MTAPKPTQVLGRTIKVGDLLYVAGKVHPVTKMTRHFHPTLGQYRIAHCDGGWNIAIYPTDYLSAYR